MKNTAEQEILDYLTNRQNLATTLEIGCRYDKIRSDIFYKFWTDLETALLNSKPKQFRSEPNLVSNVPNSDWINPFHWLGRNWRVHPGTQKTYLRYSVSQQVEPNCYSLFIGISWSEWQNKNSCVWNEPAVNQLRNKLLNLGYSHEEPPAVWLVFKNVQDDFRTENIMLEKYAFESESIIKQTCDEFWELVINSFPLVEKVNTDVKGLRKG
jgi:hypothetical protein